MGAYINQKDIEKLESRVGYVVIGMVFFCGTTVGMGVGYLTACLLTWLGS
jgi:hypothetical protein